MKRTIASALAALGAGQALSGCVVATSSSSDGSGAFFFLLLPLAFVVLFAFLARRGNRTRGTWNVGRGGSARAVRAEDDAVNAQVLRAELSVLADDVMRLEPRVALQEAARDDYEAATHRYRVAQAAMDYAEAPVDLVRVQRVVDEANWSMSRTRAILEGRTPPEPPAKLQRPGPHGEPALAVDEAQHPVYVDSSAPFRSGWFSVGGGLFSGLLLGTMLGGFGGGWVVHDHEAEGFGDDADW